MHEIMLIKNNPGGMPLAHLFATFAPGPVLATLLALVMMGGSRNS